MTGVCVDGRVHLAQNGSDLIGIAMRVRDEAIEIFLFCVISLGEQRRKQSVALAVAGAEAVVCGGQRREIGAVEGEKVDQCDLADNGQ